MLPWRRQAAAAASAGWRRIPFLSSRRRGGCQGIAFLHTHSVLWATSDGVVERCKLVTFRPLQCSTPLHAVTANDTTRASTALRLLREGRTLVYAGGDYRNARQLLAAVKRKCAGSSGAHRRKERAQRRKLTVVHPVEGTGEVSVAQQWMKQKQLQREQSELVGRLLIQVSLEDGRPIEILGLNRTPANVIDILLFAFQNDHNLAPRVNGTASKSSFLLSLNDFLAMIGGYEWNRKGVYIDALQGYIYPHFGVFPPTRQDYIQLLDRIKVNRTHDGPVRMMEVGIGTGVLSMILLQRKVVDRVIGTDVNPYAIACARDNMERLGLQKRVESIVEADLFPPRDATKDNETHKVDVVLFNPPWIPGDATTWFDSAVYDPNQRILRRFLLQVQHHVKEDGCVYLLLSNLGVLLGLFRMEDLHDMFAEGNLEVVEVYDTKSKAELAGRRPTKTVDELDAGIASARAWEVVSLYRLRLKSR